MTIALGSNEVVLGGISSGRRKLSSLHLKIMDDGTGSTGAFIPGVTAVAQDVALELPKRLHCTFGLHVGRDRDYDKEHDINLGDDLSPEELVKQLSLIRYEGGGDELETQLDSILEVAHTTAWKSGEGARLAIVVITSSGSKPARDGSDGAAVGAKLRALGIKVVVIAPPGALNVHDVALHSGGESMPLSNAPSAEDLARLRARLTKSLTLIAGSTHTGTVGIGAPAFGHNGTVAI